MLIKRDHGPSAKDVNKKSIRLSAKDVNKKRDHRPSAKDVNKESIDCLLRMLLKRDHRPSAKDGHKEIIGRLLKMEIKNHRLSPENVIKKRS